MYPVHGIHTWHRIMSAASSHHQVNRKLIPMVWTPAVNLIEVVTKDEAIPVGIITTGSIW
jgi:hypothetical protein